ncbi:DEAD/DEAH box helicase [Candidatus Symbiobacter mobilis]|uniref:DNA/RNA SNF2 family helicase n=1 Tax=Candidatus Symbiobacter mobilis CR TaxID=946483 RepID=U5NE75_9BURK|nr:DEAD/DEAH box helicase [Candidatus Symbiobacter mobilis]AGX88439.1 DNA/RNA SNF2 family helicase [Candidatus Symbiobacter mobilis CR]
MLPHPTTTTPWLNLRSLEKSCRLGVFHLANDFYLKQYVTDVSVEQLGEDWLIKGELRGPEKHQLFHPTVNLIRGGEGTVIHWIGTCGCRKHYCAHAAALLLKVAYRGTAWVMQQLGTASVSATVSPAEAAAKAHAAKLEAERERTRLQLTQWLHTQELFTPVSTPRSTSASAPAASRSANQLLYLLGWELAKNDIPKLYLDVVQCRRKVSSDGWTKVKRVGVHLVSGVGTDLLCTEEDRDIMRMLQTLPSKKAPTAYTHYYYSGYSPYDTHTSAIIEGRWGMQALQMALQTGRIYTQDTQGQPVLPVTWGEPQPVRWAWRNDPSDSFEGGLWTLYPEHDHPGELFVPTQPPLYCQPTLGVCGPLDLQGMEVSRFAALLQAPPIPTETLQAPPLELMRLLGTLPLPPAIPRPPTVAGVQPRALLHLQRVPAMDTPYKGLAQATLTFDYAGHRGWWTGQGSSVMVEGPEGSVLLYRETQAEVESIDKLLALGFTALSSASHNVFVVAPPASQSVWPGWADSDYAALREAGFDIEVGEELRDWVRHADTLHVALAPEGDDERTSSWFDLSLGVEVDGVRHNILPWVPHLLAEAAKNPRDPESGLPTLPPYLYLTTTEQMQFLRIPTQDIRPWIGALLDLFGEHGHDFSHESLRLSRYAALRTTAALGVGAVWEGANHLQDMVQQLRGCSTLPSMDMPANVVAELRPYQRLGVDWLQFLREHGLAGILADDMGLGKTLQALVHIQIEKNAGRLEHPALIIAPVSLMGNWRRECERFCPELRPIVMHGKDRHELAECMTDHDVVIAPYSLLHRDRDRWLQARWHLVILDEAQNIKNANTHAAQVASELPATHRVCLSGTPMENHLGEIWSLFHFLMPGFLGSHKRFTELFRNPIEKQGDTATMRQLRARVTPFILRRTKDIVASELPPKVETISRIELSGKQADLYETIRLGMEKIVREALQNKGLAQSQITILDALLKLRQVCCHPQLLQLEAARKIHQSAKLEYLMDTLPEMLAEGRRVLLFSQFTSMLSLIEVELAQRNLRWAKLTGQTRKRDEVIAQFTDGEVPLFLISLKAGGVGLNLPQADTVIHYDPWWNPAVENQATDRAHRIGQTQSVWVLKLVAQGTIEERILALQERKAALAQGMYSDAQERKQPLFTEGDLAELLRPLSAA